MEMNNSVLSDGDFCSQDGVLQNPVSESILAEGSEPEHVCIYQCTYSDESKYLPRPKSGTQNLTLFSLYSEILVPHILLCVIFCDKC